MKKIFTAIIIILSLFLLLTACDSDNESDNITAEVSGEYDAWKTGSNADDYNSDGVIDENDYKLWQDFLVWRDTDEAFDYDSDRRITIFDFTYYDGFRNWRVSSSALDLNGDRKISIEDYVLYRDPSKVNFLSWMNSNNAIDTDGNGKIDEDDYALVKEYVEFIGSFHIEDFEYSGGYVYFEDSMFAINDFASYAPSMDFSIDKYGNLSCEMPSAMINSLGADIRYVRDAINGCRVRRLSPQVVTVDIVIPRESITFSFYLTKDGADYRTSFDWRIDNVTVNISFRIIYDRA